MGSVHCDTRIYCGGRIVLLPLFALTILLALNHGAALMNEAIHLLPAVLQKALAL